MYFELPPNHWCFPSVVRHTALGETSGKFVATTGNTIRQRKEIKDVYSLGNPHTNKECAHSFIKYLICLHIRYHVKNKYENLRVNVKSLFYLA